MRTILIDGDILAYSIGFSVEAPVYVCGGRMYTCRGKADRYAKESGNDVVKRKNIGSFNQVELNLRMKMKTIFEDLGTKKYKMYITASGIENNFRHKLGTFMVYKDNRKKSERPFHYEKVRKLLVDKYNAELITGQEADDAIGIEQYRMASKYDSFEGTYIASIDKDLKMLEGDHYNLNSRLIEHVSAEEGLKNFYGQILKGDTTDNIPGLTKLLKLKNRLEEANKLSYSRPGFLKTYTQLSVDHNAEECYNHVVGLYKSYGFGCTEISEIGQLLWIRREENELWQPKQL